MAAKDRPLAMFAANFCFGQTGVDRLNSGLCPMCGQKPFLFRDDKSAAEFEINGMCQECQDRTFMEEINERPH